VIYETTPLAVAVFVAFVVAVLALSIWLGSRARSAGGYFAAHGQVGWFVNGIAFAGDYLSAASFLGICGMIAFSGYDGFLYSIGYLAGWIVALFVIAEPVKRLGRFTLADALNARFQSRGIKVVAAVSTLVISLFYLVPQMVGAGALVKPLLGLPHWAGVVMVGIVVTGIVATAGMVSTTWVQFIKGTLLVAICTFVVALILGRGFALPERPIPQDTVQTYRKDASGTFVNGAPMSADNQLDSKLRRDFGTGFGSIASLPGGVSETGPLGPIEYIRVFSDSTVTTWKKGSDAAGDTAFSPVERKGSDLLLPGGSPTFKGVRADSIASKLDFISLMLALFLGTASLPHILIRYYTVRDPAAARKSTVVGIGAIGIFYVLTLYLGIGAMTSGALDPTDSNMSAPLLAKTFGDGLFAVIRKRPGHGGSGRGRTRPDEGRDADGAERRTAGPRREDRSRASWDWRDHPWHPLRADERDLPRRLGLQCGRERESAGAGDAVVLERHHAAGSHRRHGDGTGLQPDVDHALGRYAREGVWLLSCRCRCFIARALQPAGDSHSPARIRNARPRVSGDPRTRRRGRRARDWTNNNVLRRQADWTLAMGSRLRQARLRYEPSAVLMMTFSPIVMNGGTRVLRPVSQVASLS
jgi:cation/acetate symporter